MGRPKGTVVHKPEEHIPSILDWLERGETLEDWCRAKEGRPGAPLIREWKRMDPQGFGIAYARAREEGGRLIAERMRKVASTPTDHPDDVAHRRLMIDTDKWLLARWFPTQFGDKQTVEHGGKLSIQVVTGVPEDKPPS